MSEWTVRDVAMKLLLLRMLLQARGSVSVNVIPPYVGATFYHERGEIMAARCAILLKRPDYIWTDRTHALRNSVKRVQPGNVVLMGGPSAPYAPYVERWGRPMRTAAREAFRYYREN